MSRDRRSQQSTSFLSAFGLMFETTAIKLRDRLKGPPGGREAHVRRTPMKERSNRWYVIASSAEITSKPSVLWRFGERYVLWRNAGGKAVALSDVCPHRGASLGLGQVKDGCIECPYHGFRFDESGQCVEIPAEPRREISRKMSTPTVPVVDSMGWLWMWRGMGRQDLPAPPNLDVINGYRHGDYSRVVTSHYTRILEAQIDYTHVPFVHRRSFGRGVPIELEVSAELTDYGFRARADAAEPRVKEQWVDLVYPNLWINMIGNGLMLSSAFAPIDDHTTEMYLRWYQKGLNVPVLGDALAKACAYWSKIIIEEDAPIVMSQIPQDISEAGRERLLPTDIPVTYYRKLRKQALAEAADPESRPANDVQPIETKKKTG